MIVVLFELTVAKGINKLPVIAAGKALKLEALTDFDDNGTIRVAGDRWQIEGPCTFVPKPECKQIGEVSPTIILENSALHLKAKIDLVDKNGNNRVTGEPYIFCSPFFVFLLYPRFH